MDLPIRNHFYLLFYGSAQQRVRRRMGLGDGNGNGSRMKNCAVFGARAVHKAPSSKGLLAAPGVAMISMEMEWIQFNAAAVCVTVCGGRRRSTLTHSRSCFSLFLKTLKGVCLCPAACLLGCCRKRRTMNGFLHQGIGLLKTLNAIVFSPGGGERKHLHWRAGKKLGCV